MVNLVRSYLAECFWPGVSEADLDALESRAAEVASVGSHPGSVRYRGLMLMPDDEVVFCFFDGPSAEAVEAVARRARVPFARIVVSTGVPHPGGLPER